MMDGAVQSQKVNNPKKLLHVAQLLEVSKLLTLQVGCSVFSIQFFFGIVTLSVVTNYK